MPHSAELLGVKGFKPSMLVGASMPYASPELLEAFQGHRYSDMKFEPDIYAFGCVLWECLHWRRIWAEMSKGELIRRVLLGERPDVDKAISKAHHRTIACIRMCWTSDPLLRPPISDTLAKISDMNGIE
jgi:hypothetical protein